MEVNVFQPELTMQAVVIRVSETLAHEVKNNIVLAFKNFCRAKYGRHAVQRKI